MTVKKTAREQPLPRGAEHCGEGALPFGGTLIPQHHLPGTLTFTSLSRASHTALPASICWMLLSPESYRATSPGFSLSPPSLFPGTSCLQPTELELPGICALGLQVAHPGKNRAIAVAP